MTLTLRPATWRDLPRLRRWRNDPETVRWSNGRRVTWRDHLGWWWSAPPWRRVYVAEVDGRPMGVGRLGSGVLGYSVDADWRGCGLGTQLVAALVAHAPPGPLWAETHADHAASHAVLRKNGFKPRKGNTEWIRW